MGVAVPEAMFEAFHATHIRDVLAYCLRRTSHTEAHDATAETFAIAWRKFDAIPTGEATLPWLYRVAANVMRNQFRSVRRARKLASKLGAQPVPAVPGPEVQVVRRAEYDEVLGAVAALKPKYREVLRLVEWEELPREEVAALLHISRAAIDQRIHRAYQQLEHHLQHLQGRPPVTEGGEHDSAQAS